MRSAPARQSGHGRRCARLITLLLIVVAGPLMAAPNPASERPTVALVLSGGGAKGMAHVGVLRVLEEMRIPVDIVVGTSAGSAVAALYAQGMAVPEIEERFIEMDWLSSFRDSPGRAYRPVRRKQNDWRYPISPGVGVGLDGLRVGRGLVAGQNLGFILNELTRDAALVRDFDALPVRFRAVATDLETGEAVVMGEGALSEAIRASMSIPGVYAPVSRDGRLLVDGGIANNLPVSVAQEMGADRIIAIDISDALADRRTLTGAFSIVGQLTTLMTRRNMDDQIQRLGDDDLLIQPDLGSLGSADFYSAAAIIEAGATATRRYAVDLQSLRVGDVLWQRYQKRRSTTRFQPGVITEVRVRDQSRLSTRFLRSRIHQPLGQPLDVPALQDDLRRIYGLGYYETVAYQLEPTPEGTALVIDVTEKSWGPNYLRFGLGYEDNFRNDTRFNVAAALQMTELNDLGGEWHTGVQLGTEPRVRSQWFQPLDFGYRRFVVAGAEYEQESYTVFGTQGQQQAEVEVSRQQVDLAFGLELANTAEARAGLQRGYARVDNVVGQANLTDERIDQGSWSLELTVDSLDDPFMPASGHYLGVKGRFERPGLGGERDFDRAALLAARAISLGPYTAVGKAFGSVVTRGETGVENTISLGGLRRLSAYARGAITGRDAALASLYGYRRFGGPFIPFFAGLGYETGNAWSDIRDARGNDLIHSWNAFAGVDTFLGPVQVSTAYADKEHWSVFLNVGYSLESLFRDL
ncbi:patatin-like phospholipase family protein [Tamilnaduibacter salinus]|nr:patatin-like phospholipase family protein [Tamilnaduibacter salinus]